MQLYVQDLVGQVTRPVKELKGFTRIALTPGEKRQVRFEVPAQSLGFYNLNMKYMVEPGTFKVWIGPNANEGLQGPFRIIE
jgi:beta-glucosidase